MQTRIEITGDGSHTLFVPELKEHYHSTFGAIRESEFVFIRSGFDQVDRMVSPVRILEMGFGTGLNAFLTFLRAEKSSGKVEYTAVEKFPLPKETVTQLNFPGILTSGDERVFAALHDSDWGKMVNISRDFSIHKIKEDLTQVSFEPDHFGLVYFDAFGPEIQPELWTEKVFQKIAFAMKQEGILVTYSSKGSVRRAMKIAGLHVEKIPGPPGKREICRAIKN
jgi:tRNA U34 5-methylaminomethyl-2-thiouridine-forming methyltransferase MnmC